MVKNRRGNKRDRIGQKAAPDNTDNGSFPTLPQGSDLTIHTGDGTSETDDKIPFQGSRYENVKLIAKG